MTSTRRNLGIATIACAAGLGLLSGCRGERSDKPPHQFLPDMDDSPKWKPQTKTRFFADERSMRPIVAGTVAFGGSMHPDDPTRGRYLKDNDAYYLGVDDKGEFLDQIPFDTMPRWPADAEGRKQAMASMIRRGQQRFNIYCSVCHGYEGDAKGMVGVRWTAPPANFHDPKYTDLTQKTGKDGYIFSTIRNGVYDATTGLQKMPPYGHAVSEADAWAIVAYVRTLQATRTTNMDEVPQAERERLAQHPPPPPPPAPPAPPPAPGASPGATTPPATPPAPPAGTGGVK
jgi:mono/diheme cytochrome c family protein